MKENDGGERGAVHFYSRKIITMTHCFLEIIINKSLARDY